MKSFTISINSYCLIVFTLLIIQWKIIKNYQIKKLINN
jgi:hypothetical protein